MMIKRTSRCMTLITVEDDRIKIKDYPLQEFGDYVNGHLILSALKETARKEKIDFGMKEPVINFSTPGCINFEVLQNTSLALGIINERFTSNKILAISSTQQQNNKMI